MENNIELKEELTPAKPLRKAFGAELTDVEKEVISRSADLNEPALCAMFELTHEQVKEILKKK